MDRDEERAEEPVRNRENEAMSGLRWRIIASIVLGTAWLIFVILYLAFWSQGFDLFQNLAILISSLLALGAALAVYWVSYGLQFARRAW